MRRFRPRRSSLQARRAVGRVSERIHFVLLSAQRHSPPEIGALMGYHAASVRTWLLAYREAEVQSFADAYLAIALCFALAVVMVPLMKKVGSPGGR